MNAMVLNLVTDVVAITVVAYGIYFRRYYRRDLLLAYISLNVGIFAVTALLADSKAGVGLGLGLFGILSIIRLRSDSITQEEIAYYFVALALGLIGGLAANSALARTRSLSAALVAVMYVVDHPRLTARASARPSSWTAPTRTGASSRPRWRRCWTRRSASRGRAARPGRGHDHGRRPVQAPGRAQRPAAGPDCRADHHRHRAGGARTPGEHVGLTVAIASLDPDDGDLAVTEYLAALEGRPPVELAELMAVAELTTRVDQKYLVPTELLTDLMARLPEQLAVLDIDGRRVFDYESVYFDTEAFALYHQHIQGRRKRFKARTRTYRDSGEMMFEVKLKGAAGRDRQGAARLRLRGGETSSPTRGGPSCTRWSTRRTASRCRHWARGSARPTAARPWSTSSNARE